MLSVAVFYLLAVICSARRTQALPLYPDTNLEPQAEFMKKLVSGVEDGSDAADGDPSPANNLYPLLMQHNGGSESWNRGMKGTAQQDKYTNVVEDLRETILKLAAADKLRAQGFLRSEQNLPKTNKRGVSVVV
ncbi:urotensin-related peptide 1 [Nelusetta ayraudi]|uniref:urotensin-related peptide 1 n=1 Tax=Nelusetta ayraudi TaxID=303726 RepID=UPI003F70F0B7